MDLGSGVCRPKSPSCDLCPLAFGCEGLKTGESARYPLKTKKAERPHRLGHAFVLRDGEGRIGLVRRPDKGLLGGMLGLPTSDWSATPAFQIPVAVDWTVAGAVEHVFTHFSLTLTVHVGAGGGDFLWTEADDALASLPTVFRKALERGLAA
ncbi:putative A/G-specific adenine glycosylase YfhQ [compost metagenome]